MDELTTIGSTELQRSVSQVLRRVYVDKERLLVERNGLPVAVIVPYQEFEEFLRLVEEKAGRKSVASKTKKA